MRLRVIPCAPFAIVAVATSLAIAASIVPLVRDSFRLKPHATTTRGDWESGAAGRDLASGFSRTAAPLPLAFERNDGQHPPHLRYAARGAGYAFALSDGGLHVGLTAAVPAEFGLTFVNSATSPRVLGESPLGSHANYFVGADPGKWRTSIPLFSRVRYENLWPGIDAVFYGNAHELEYDVIVAPGADPARARFAIEGADDAHVTATGELALSVAGRDVTYSEPIAYQEINGTRHAVAAQYVLAGRTLSFVMGPYDREQPLVIDPILHFSTYYGFTGVDSINDVATDGAGNIYIVGSTEALPATYYPGLPRQGGILISKFDPDVKELRYQVVIGASAWSSSSAIAVDPRGNVYLAGITAAADFPIRNAFEPVNQFGGECECDGFVLKLAASGNSLLYSTFLGGNNDDSVRDIAVNASGEAFVGGGTHSPDFPVANAADPTYSGGRDFEEPGDGFAVRFSRTGSSVIYSTYLHGSWGGSIALDAANRAYIGGGTPLDLLQTTSNAAQRTRGGDYDGTLVRLGANGAWQYATYLGGPSYDIVQGIDVDPAGHTHLALYSSGGGFPTTANAYQRTAAGGADVVIATIAASGARTYATYYGGTDHDFGWAMDADPWGRVTVVGGTWGTIPLTPDAYQAAAGGWSDVFAATFDGPVLTYATRLGGAVADSASAVAIHQTGRITIVGVTQSANFPVRNAVQNTCGPGDRCHDGFIAQFAPREPGTFDSRSGVIVLHAADAEVVSGAWRRVADPTAAGGMRLEHPDAGAPKVTAPLANPTDYFELSANVVSGRDYEIWIRGKAQGNSYSNDSVYVQYSNLAGGDGRNPPPRIGSADAQTIVLEDCTGCRLSGWGWQDAAFGLDTMAAAPGEFAASTTTIRVQAREDGISIDQIVLIPGGRSWAPGFQKQDATIYEPRNGGEEPAIGEIVLYAGVDSPQLHGGWRVVSDSTAAGGLRATHPNAHGARIAAPLAAPTHYLDLTFTADADTPYFFYLRGKADANSPYNDSVWVQLSNTPWAPGTTEALAVNLELCNGVGLSGWGWRDNHWCDPEGYDGGGTVYFSKSGAQTIRIQTREDGISIDQIVFSTTRTQPPGPPRDDTTILPRP